MSGMSKLWMALLTVVVWALAATAAQAQTTIKAGDSSWTPDAVTVPTGATVRWEFDQTTVPHTVTSTSGNWSKNESREPGGAAVTHRFTAPGTYTFRCDLHGGMTGTVTVESFDVLVFSRTTGFRHETAIAAGRTAIQQMGTAEDFNVQLSEDQTLFTDAGLRPFEVVVFLNTDGEGILNGAQRNAFERWTQRGGGIVSIHADANADRNWAWKGDMIGGAWFLNHPAPPVQFQQATVNVVDTTHPATRDLPQPNWVRTDEWYNFTAEPRERPRPAQARREHLRRAGRHRRPPTTTRSRGARTTTAGGTSTPRSGMRACTGRSTTTATTSAAPSSGPRARRPATAGPTARASRPTRRSTRSRSTTTPRTRWRSPSRATATSTTSSSPAAVKRYDRATSAVQTVATIPVHRGNENGLLGITLDPNFDTNHHLYLFYSPPTPEVQRVRASRWRRRQRSLTSERAAARVPAPADHLLPLVRLDDLRARRQPLHLDRRRLAARGVAGLQPERRPAANKPGDNPDADQARDARRTSGNTNDLRGKILRIKPVADPTGAPGPGNTYDDPGRQPLRPRRQVPGRRRPDAARDLHDGPPQPVPDPGRLRDGLAL